MYFVATVMSDQVNKRTSRNWNDRPCPLSVNGNNTYCLEHTMSYPWPDRLPRDIEKKNTIKITEQPVTILWIRFLFFFFFFLRRNYPAKLLRKDKHTKRHASLTLLNGDSFTNSRKRCETVARPETKVGQEEGDLPLSGAPRWGPNRGTHNIREPISRLQQLRIFQSLSRAVLFVAKNEVEKSNWHLEYVLLFVL